MVYLYTNESFEATLKGLDIKKGDEVLSIGGSGDVAFAILEKNVERLVVADIDEKQLQLVNERANALSNKEDEMFTNPEEIVKESGGTLEKTSREARRLRSEYFSYDDRLESIRENLFKLIVMEEPIDISNVGFTISELQYDKIYLSNIFYKLDEPAEVEEKLKNISKFLREKGKMIIYLTNETVIEHLKSLSAYDEKSTKVAEDLNEKYREKLEDLEMEYKKSPLVFGKF